MILRLKIVAEESETSFMHLSFRRAVFLKFSLCIWALCVGFAGGFFLWEVFGNRAKFEEQRTVELRHHLRLSQDLLEKEKARELVEVLRHALRTGDIDFYGWKQEGKWVSFEGKEPSGALEAQEGLVARSGQSIVAMVQRGEVQLILGSQVSWQAKAEIILATRLSYFAKDIFFLGLSLFAICIFFFQEIARTLFPRPAVQRVQRVSSTTEPKLLRESRELKGQQSGTFASLQLPQSFDVTNAEKAQAFGGLVERCERLAERYGGRIIESGCTGSSFLFAEPNLALAAARDWQALAPAVVYISQGSTFPGPSGQPHYGADLARGLKRLSSLELESGTWAAEPLPEVSFRQEARKGQICILPAFALKDVLDQARDGKAGNLVLFRSDEALLVCLKELLIGTWSREAFLGTLCALRTFYCKSSSQLLAEAYTSLLANELQLGDSYRISSALALATHLFHPRAVSRDMEKNFLDALALNDRRIKANAIEVFIHFFPEREISALRPYVRDIDNRVSANALVKAALERFDDNIVRKIEERLNGGSVAHVASALYAVGEIALYYKRTDPLYLGTKVAFLRVFETIPAWVSHPNPMVGRQALVAAKKLGDGALNRRLEQLFQSNKDEALGELFATVYGWRKDQKQAA